MARSTLPVTGIGHDGADPPTPTVMDPDNGLSVANPDGRTLLQVTNTGDTAHDLTIAITVTVDGQPVTPRTVTVPAGQTRLCGPYDQYRYGRTLLLDGDSDELTVAALRLGDSIFTPGGVAPFTFSSPAVVADLAAAGLTVAGQVLSVDTVLTSSTVDGGVLVVTV